jgi:hypothetical protein
MSVGGLSSPCYLAEWYLPAPSGAQLDQATARIEACVSSMPAGAHVRLLAIVGVPADEVIFGIFIADSEGDVSEVCRQAGMAAQRVTAAVGFASVAEHVSSRSPRSAATARPSAPRTGRGSPQ